MLSSRRPRKPPVMFKVDFTIDADNHLRIFELGHPFSDNQRGLGDNILNLVKKLHENYERVYLSGDYHECHCIIDSLKGKLPYAVDYVAIECLAAIRTPNSIVIVRCKESPTHYTPYCVQQDLKMQGSDLVVFGAEPLACLVAYEKIIMQRLQALTGNPYFIPSALVDLSSRENMGSVLRDQLGRHMELPIKYIIKPAFSSCGFDIRCCQTKEEVISVLTDLQSRYRSSRSYRRAAEDFSSMLCVGDRAWNLQQRSQSIVRFVKEKGLNYLLPALNTDAIPDPFFIVQQVVFSPCVIHEGKPFMLTYRTFILIEEEGHSVKVSLLEKIAVFYPKKPLLSDHVAVDNIVAGVSTSNMFGYVSVDSVVESILNKLNNAEHKQFFSVIFHGSVEGVRRCLFPAFPDLSSYWQAMSLYPPYQVMFEKSACNEEIKKYENLMFVFKLQFAELYLNQYAAQSSLILPYAIQTLELFNKIYKENRVTAFSCSYFFMSLLFNKTILNICQTQSSMYGNGKKDFLNLMLGVLVVMVNLTKGTLQSTPLPLINFCLNKIVRALKDFRQGERAQYEDVLFCVHLHRLESAVSHRGESLDGVEDFSERKSTFLSWSNLYFQRISVPVLPSLMSIR
jgi:hypothetical protein